MVRPSWAGFARRSPAHWAVRRAFVLPKSTGDADDAPLGAADPFTRDRRLARLEAALMLADEPISARRLATAAELADPAEARHLVGRLREMLDRDGSRSRSTKSRAATNYSRAPPINRG